MVTTFNKYSKLFVTALIIPFFLQFCTVYHKNTVTVEQAVYSEQRRIKIITGDDRKLFFESIYYKNDELFGILDKSKKSEETEIKIIPGSIKEIHLYNKTASRAITATVCIGIPAAIIAVGITTFEMDLSEMDFD